MAENATRYLLRCSLEELARWKAAAEADGRPLAQWIRRQLNQATQPSSPQPQGSTKRQ